MTLFDILKDVIKEKKGNLWQDETFEEAFNAFMIARFLSMREEYIGYAQWINQNTKMLSKKDIYRYLVKGLPRSNNYFIKYIKKPKKSKEDESDE